MISHLSRKLATLVLVSKKNFDLSPKNCNFVFLICFLVLSKGTSKILASFYHSRDFWAVRGGFCKTCATSTQFNGRITPRINILTRITKGNQIFKSNSYLRCFLHKYFGDRREVPIKKVHLHCDALGIWYYLHNLKNRKKHLQKCFNFSEAAESKSNTHPQSFFAMVYILRSK